MFGWSPIRVALVAMLIACNVSPETPVVDSSSSTIINGNRDRRKPWTVAVLNLGLAGTGGLCSGTLIGDYVVLTAKHCVYEDRGGATWDPVPRSSLLIVKGHDVTSAAGIEDMVPPYEVRSTPGNYTDSDLGDGDDIAVILLPRRLDDVTPRPIATNNPSPGQAAEIVGFGINNTSTEESGLKYSGDTAIAGVGSRLIEAAGASNTCQGDSGGPLLVANRVVGVTSFGTGGCGRFSRHFFTNVQRHRALIDGALAFEPPCEPAGEGCDGFDNDCDDIIDEGCTGLGDACTRDEECINGACEDVDGSMICIRDCDPRTVIPMCPVGFHCEALSCGAGRCLAGGEGPKPEGEPCAGNLECNSGRCTMIAGEMRCGRQCDPAAADCATGTLCEDTGDGCGTCLPVELSTAPRPFGAPCEEDSDCASGDCAEGEGASEDFCTTTCGVCPGGFHCREGRCVNGDLGGPGDGCLVNDDCAAADCIDIDGDRVCAPECGEGCVDGFSCIPTSVGDRCVADGLALGEACTDSAECRTRICAGTCTRICDDAPCPDGFDCLPAGEVSGCFPAGMPMMPEGGGGGCSTSAGGSGAVMALMLLVFFRRRR